MKVYPIPSDIEHVAFASFFLNKEIADIKADPATAQQLVPSIIIIRNDKVVGVATGVSGLEIGYNVRHSREALEATHQLVWQFVRKGELSVSESLEEDRVIYKYALR